MRLKSFLTLFSFVCAAFCICVAIYSMHWTAVCELFPHLRPIDSNEPLAVVRALNFALPFSALCMVILMRLPKQERIGPFGLTTLLLLNFAAVDMSLRSKDAIFGREMHLSKVAWWMPVQGAGEDIIIRGGPGVTLRASQRPQS